MIRSASARARSVGIAFLLLALPVLAAPVFAAPAAVPGLRDEHLSADYWVDRPTGQPPDPRSRRRRHPERGDGQSRAVAA